MLSPARLALPGVSLVQVSARRVPAQLSLPRDRFFADNRGSVTGPLFACCQSIVSARDRAGSRRSPTQAVSEQKLRSSASQSEAEEGHPRCCGADLVALSMAVAPPPQQDTKEPSSGGAAGDPFMPPNAKQSKAVSQSTDASHACRQCCRPGNLSGLFPSRSQVPLSRLRHPLLLRPLRKAA